jgi:hypothetical protein
MNLSQASRSSVRESNRRPPEYEAVMPTTRHDVRSNDKETKAAREQTAIINRAV